ncbi:MAG: PEP-CTERM sorting domain-containing protein [Phycisphaerae bacterium]|jgi:hypothetical protein
MRISIRVAAVVVGLSSGWAFAGVTGEWDFTGGLTATIGNDLQYGDAGTAAGTSFNKTSGFGIHSVVPTDAAGNPTGPAVDADVMSFPKTPGNGTGYKMFPGAAANGSFSPGDVNQYSMIWDVYWPAASSGKWRALLQTNATNTGSNDGDYFINPSNGVGISGVYHGTVPAETWTRIGLVVNLDAPAGQPTFFKYINGNLVGSQVLNNSRWSIWSDASGNPSWVLSDNDGDTEAGYVDKIRFYDTALSESEMAALGGLTNGPVIPEPATLGLLGLGAAALLRRRRAGA